jgi:transcriptional regulator with XRE-family HTH domain
MGIYTYFCSARVSRKTISDAENDVYDITLATLEKILRAYNLTLKDFFESRVWTDKERLGEDDKSSWA